MGTTLFSLKGLEKDIRLFTQLPIRTKNHDMLLGTIELSLLWKETFLNITILTLHLQIPKKKNTM